MSEVVCTYKLERDEKVSSRKASVVSMPMDDEWMYPLWMPRKILAEVLRYVR